MLVSMTMELVSFNCSCLFNTVIKLREKNHNANQINLPFIQLLWYVARKKNDLGFVHLKIHLAATSLNKLLSLSENKKVVKSKR